MKELSFFLKFIQEDLKQLQHPSTTEEALHEAIRTLAREAQIAQHQLEEALMSCTVSELREQVQQRQLAITILADRLQRFINEEDFNNYNPFLPVTFGSVVVNCYQSLEQILNSLAEHWSIYYNPDIRLPAFYYIWTLEGLSIEREHSETFLKSLGIDQKLIDITLRPFDKASAQYKPYSEGIAMIGYYQRLFHQILTEFTHSREQNANQQLMELLWQNDHNSPEMLSHCQDEIMKTGEGLSLFEQLHLLQSVAAEVQSRGQRRNERLYSERHSMSDLLLLWLDVETKNLEHQIDQAYETEGKPQLQTQVPTPVLATLFSYLFDRKVIHAKKPVELFRLVSEHFLSRDEKQIDQEYFRKCFYVPTPKSAAGVRRLLSDIQKDLTRQFPD